jgi:hypothetical protein
MPAGQRPGGSPTGPSAVTRAASASNRSSRTPWLLGIAVVIGLAVILSESLVAYRTAIVPARQQSSTVRRVGAEAGQPVSASQADPQYYIDFDGYYWVSYAREMVSEGELRVRRTNLDNAPFGRSVDWSSVFGWWLVLLGGIHALVSTLSVDAAIGVAAYYANPVLMAVMLGAVGWLIYRRLGERASMLLVLLLALQPALLMDFGYGRPDHHGLHLICALGVVLLAVLGGGGWVLRDGDDDRPKTGGNAGPAGPDVDFALPIETARRWFVASGVVGGCGLWIGATQQALIIGCVGIGGFFAMIGATRGGDADAGKGFVNEGDRWLRWEPDLWRLWSRVGALTSVLAYVIEYFPGHLGMQLEVNHPLYALAWFCGGEILASVGEHRLAGTPLRGSRFAKLGLLAGGIAVLPVLAFWGPTEWYVLRDPLMLRVHSVIGEFRPLMSETHDPWILARELSPALLVLVGIGFALSRRRRLSGSLLAISLVPAVCLAVLFLVQLRWGGLFVVVSCVVVVPLILIATQAGPKPNRSRVAAALLLAAVALQLVPNAGRVLSRADDRADGSATLSLVDEVFARDIALALGAGVEPGSPPLTVMTGFGEGSRIFFFGQTRAAGSLYWENLDGLRDTVDFFADHGEEAALRIARTRGIDYVVVTTDIVSMAQMLKTGTNDPEEIRRTLGYRLIRPEYGAPAWCRPVRVRGFRWNDRCLIYRVMGLEEESGRDRSP